MSLFTLAVTAAALTCGISISLAADGPLRSDDSDWYRHIDTSEPRLPNRPARRENISDEEVREVQRAAAEIYPDFIVMISGVTEGCECEEGSHCTAQVGLALNRDNKTRSLVLSKINGHWKIGAVQSWWLHYSANHTEFSGSGGTEAWLAWREKEQSLLKSFPACPVPAGNCMLLRKDNFGSTFADMANMTVSGVVRRVNIKHANPTPTWKPTPFWIRFSIAVEAFDCKDHRERTDKITLYREDATAQLGSVKDPVLWDPIRPDTTSAADLELVCGWKVKERTISR